MKKIVAIPKYHSEANMQIFSSEKIQEIRQIFKTGSLEDVKNLNLKGDEWMDGWTPLLLIASQVLPEIDEPDQRNNEVKRICEVAAYFLKNDAEINARGWLNRTALHFACSQNNVALARLLLSNPSIDVAQPDVLGDRPIHRAAVNGSPELINLILEAKGSDIDCQNNELKTPLLRAVSVSPVAKRSPQLAENIECLIKKGTDISVEDVYGHYYAYYESLEADLEADIDAKQIVPVENADARKNAVMQGNLDDCKVLFQSDGNVMGAVNYLGDSVLSTASLLGRIEILKFAVNDCSDADINHENIEKKRPLYWAVYKNQIDIVEFFLTRPGIDLDFQESVLGETVLQRAVINRCIPIIYQLLERGAPTLIQNRFGQTALHLCVINPIVNNEILHLLLQHMSFIDQKDKTGRTALIVAAEKNHREAIGLLLEHGADAYVEYQGQKAVEIFPEIKICLTKRDAQDQLIELLKHEITKLDQLTDHSKINEIKEEIERILKELNNDIRRFPLDFIEYIYLNSIGNEAKSKILEAVLYEIAISDLYKKEKILTFLKGKKESLPGESRRYIRGARKRIKRAEPRALIDKIARYNPEQVHVEFSSEKAEKDTYNILSIDGGGIRGIIPAIVLCELEKRTKQPISRLFNLVAGTSTGGILAGALTTPGGASNVPRFSAFDLLDLYTRRASEIFPPIPFYRWPLFSIKYSEEPLEAIAHNYFGDRRLSHSLTSLIITSYEANVRRPYFFNSELVLRKQQKNYLMRDIIRATSAAPTFLPPKIIEEHTFLDGGITTNNPAETAVCWAEKIGYEKQHMFVLSLGTGQERSKPIDHSTLLGGKWFWASTIPGLAINGTSFNVDSNLSDSFTLFKDHYFRFQAYMKQAIPLDGVEYENIHSLVDSGYQLIEDKKDELDKVVEILVHD